MLNLVVMFAVSLISIIQVQTSQLSRNDIEAILNVIQPQQRSESNSDSDSFERTALKNSQLINLLQQSLNEKKNRDRKERKELIYRYQGNQNGDDFDQILDQNLIDDDGYVEKKKMRPYDLLAQITDKSSKPQVKKKLKPSNLLEPYQDRGERSLSEYSKIYVLLNPDAVKTSQNKIKFEALLTRLLAASSASKYTADTSTADFRLGPYSTLLSQRRLSDNGYMRDSLEDRPKRPRYSNYGGGGGGGGSGRTAIPYIRQRAAFIPIDVIYAIPSLNIDDLLDIIAQKQTPEEKRAISSESSSDSIDADVDDKTLRGRNLVQFFQRNLDNNKNVKFSKNKHLSDLYSYLANFKSDSHDRLADRDDKSHVDKLNSRQLSRLLQYLLSQNALKQQKVEDDAKYKNRQEGADNGNKYSRIYIILNPDDLESDQNKKKISALVAGLTSKLALSKNDENGKMNRYKGFPTKADFVQRRRRDSMEDSMDEGKRRPRYSNYGGNGGRGRDGYRGGSGGGRTAIPFIRQRGDIYERDH